MRTPIPSIAFSLAVVSIALSPALQASPHPGVCAPAPGAAALAAMPGTPVVLEALEEPAGPWVGDAFPIGEPGAEETHACTGKIQPGVRMISPAGCTMNWVFRDAEGAFYIGTAGHCTSFVGQSVSVSGVGFIGTVAFRMNAGIGNDFSLVRIDPSLYGLVDPTLCHWGGPVAAVTPSPGDRVLVYGQGNIYGFTSTTRPRAGTMSSVTSTTVTYVSFTQPGDSGMPVMTDGGEAVGIHTHGFLHFSGVSLDPAPKSGTLVPHAMAAAGAALATTLALEPGTLPVSLIGT